MRSSSGRVGLLANHFRRSFSSAPASEIASSVAGNIGTITLDRPKKFNALTMGMIRDLHPIYAEWLTPQSPVKCIVMAGAGGKAFCAGGDVAAVQIASIAGDDPLPFDFFYDEYQLNGIIATMFERQGMPQIALWDGVTMGGGVGLSVHGKFRVATEKTLFAKPETAIGLFPDVGGTHVLARVNGGEPVGLYVGLTGVRLGAADCLHAGLATHYVPSANIPQLLQDLENLAEDAGDADKVDKVLLDARGGAEPDSSKAVLATNADLIQHCFGQNTAEEIVAELEKASADSEWAATTLKTLLRMSPTSIKLTIEASHRHAAEGCTITDCLVTEYRMVQRCMRPQPDSDFYEGIRAVLIDKDQSPVWNPAALEDVSDGAIQAFFDPLAADHPRGELVHIC